MEYKLKFDFWKIDCDVLKEKEMNKIIWILGQSRHGRDISFKSYGELLFIGSDTNHLKPVVTSMDNYHRRRSNVMIMDIHMTKGTTYYDKLFLYHSNNTKIGNYGYVLYNSKTKQCKHQYFIYDDLNDLIQHINKALNKMARNETDGFPPKKMCSLEKNVYIDNNGLLMVNDWCRRVYPPLQTIFVDKEVYRDPKSFVAS